MRFSWKDSETPEQNTHRVLPKLVRSYFKSGRAAMRHERTWDALHEFRLESKRFRYTLELFRPLYGPEMEDRIGSLKKLQQLLGEINDCVATSELLADHGEYEALRKRLDQKARKKTQQLFKHWREKFDAEGEEARWEAVLRGSTGEPAAEVPQPQPETVSTS